MSLDSGDMVANAQDSTRPARRVVVAEDEALIRLDLVEMLREEGFDVVGEAGDGEQAVALARELTPDLVVLDVKMPVMDGLSAAEQIGKENLAPCVMLTAFSQAELVERAFRLKKDTNQFSDGDLPMLMAAAGNDAMREVHLG